MKSDLGFWGWDDVVDMMPVGRSAIDPGCRSDDVVLRRVE